MPRRCSVCLSNHLVDVETERLNRMSRIESLPSGFPLARQQYSGTRRITSRTRKARYPGRVSWPLLPIR